MTGVWTVPTLVELVDPLKPLTRTLEAFGGLRKSEALLEIQAVAPPSTRISKESESNIALEPVEGAALAAALARTKPVNAKCARMLDRARRLRTFHDRK
jgi:hypothetical protein